MSDFLHPNNDFLLKVISFIDENLDDEHFGVPDLAERMNMSRSNLLRKVKKQAGVSVSVYIRQVRLYHAKEMLRDDTFTVSEVSYKVGFNSVSYFTKCFREEFGYTPGSESKRTEVLKPAGSIAPTRSGYLYAIGAFIIAGLVGGIIFFKNLSTESRVTYPLEKTIAVLPFKNDSNDSSNVYIINGLMEAILDNLQKIDDLEVTSRTSVEKYRGMDKTIPELSRELEVNYFVEGSGQKVGDQILLSIQLINARTDKHVWSQQYEREAKDIFKLQTEVARHIAGKIEAIITPEEEKLIEKVPTQNLVAYDNYLKGMEIMKDETGKNLNEAIRSFEKAIVEDDQFAQPYANIAICYYYMDIYQVDKKYGLEINTYADKALLLDSELPESLVAKALFYMQDKQYEFAVKYFEKALKYNPNLAWVHNFLSDIYTNYLPNTEKYLTHALQGIKVAVADQDSSTASYTYLHLSNALAQTGFIKEAEQYIKKSLEYNPQNLYAEHLYVFIRLARKFDIERAKKDLISILQKDTTRLDIIQEIAKVCYTMGDYKEAWEYYEKFILLKEKYNLDIYPGEDIKIAFVLEQLDRKEEGEKYRKSFLEYAQNDQSIYKELIQASYCAEIGNVEEGIKNLRAFTKQRNYLYWIVLFVENDPIMSRLSEHPDYTTTIEKIKENFWTQHREIRKQLEEEGVI